MTNDFSQLPNNEAKVSPQKKIDKKIENKENQILIKENEKLKKENEILKKENEDLRIKLNNFNLIKNNDIKKIEENYKKLIEEKNKIIEDLKTKLQNYGIEPDNFNNSNLLEGEKIVALNFISVDQEINHVIFCKNTTEFHDIEGLLYKKYPQYSDGSNFFMFNGGPIERFKTLKDNNILGYTIMLKRME